ncbi:MAG: hypothetical protein EA398_16580 [Deltaproteobacteria bacterium]|nr:MAG: hypothetical protein EA398_16580 [Deltaproteobacteria bacterium]
MSIPRQSMLCPLRLRSARHLVPTFLALVALVFLLASCGSRDETRCGDGTRFEDGFCVSAESPCAEGTVRTADGLCVAADRFCGDGTLLEGGFCVPVDGCGAGTVRTESGSCVALDTFCALGTVFDRGTGGCVAEGGAACGEGTVESGGRCIPAPSVCPAPLVLEASGERCAVPDAICDEGTARDIDTGRCVPAPDRCAPGSAWRAADEACVAVADACGDGTRWDETEGFCFPEAGYCGVAVVWDTDLERCVPEESPCADGTVADAEGRCVVDAAEVCGPGTMLDDATLTCILPAGSCGPGTLLSTDGESCLASADACGPRTQWNDSTGRCDPSPEVCGPGTTWVAFAGGCLADEDPASRCGANTVWDETILRCVPDPELCTGGSVFDENGLCVPSEDVCPAGTVWNPDDAQCEVTAEVCGPDTEPDPDTGACVPAGTVCGDGTFWNPQTRRCDTQGIACGDGTRLDDTSGRCVVDDQACGEGTTLDAGTGTCIPDAGACGSGTVWDADAGACIFAASGCLEGTVFDEEEQGCIPSEDVCGPGTTWVAEERRCFRGTLLFGDCEEPPTLTNIRDNVILPQNNCYLVPANRDVNSGGELTIEPGVTLIFAAGAGFTVGATGAIRALGTEDAPILFTGVDAVPGFWRGLRIAQSNNPINRLRHVIVEYAGDTPWDSGVEITRAGILLQSLGGAARLSITDVTARHNLGYGFSVRSAVGPSICATAGYVTIDEFARNTFHDNSVAPMRIFNDIAGVVDTESSFTGNGTDVITVYGSGCRDLISDQTWVDPGVPYRSVGRFLLTAGTRLTLEEGVEIRFARETGMDLRGVFTARGSEERPVRLTSTEGTPGSWNGVRWSNNTGPDSWMEHVVIENGGGTAYQSSRPAGLTITDATGNITARLRHVTIRDSIGSGLFIHGAGVTLDVFEDNTFTGNSTYPVVLGARQVTRLDGGSAFTGNAIDAIRVESLGFFASQVGVIPADGTLRRLEVPWSVSEGLRVRDGATLTIEAGAHLRFDLNTWFRIGDGNSPGYVRIQGEPDAPVVLEGSESVAGWWRGFLVGNSLNPLNEINHLTVRHGGSEQWSGALQPANVHLTGSGGASRLRVNGLRVEDGLGAGLFVSDGVDFLSCQDVTFDGVSPLVIGNVPYFEDNCGPLEPVDPDGD